MCAAILLDFSVLQLLNHPWVLRTLQISPERSLQQRLTDYWAHGAQLLAEGAPHVSTLSVLSLYNAH